ncbi:MAG: 1,4-alpha-glucan branching protein GlgB [Clostridia bacterium]|nr:1,4-alpha-glucan branching protein GlgB [Clostridia bacterium]
MAEKKTRKRTAKTSLPDHGQAAYFFHQGTTCKAYEYLGVHKEGVDYAFRVWAPNADEVWVCGDFNGWKPDAIPMKRITDRGIWEATVSADVLGEGAVYKYRIRNGDKEIYKADPYGYYMQLPPATASVVCDIDGYQWRDRGWMKYRTGKFDRQSVMKQPMNIYEIHPGSWVRNDEGEPLTYVDLARELSSYVKQMGYTHVELMPVSEHPFDGSWGYQVCGYYAPTSRFGTPKDFMEFVDCMHEAGIGVILDWVPAHFPKDAHGLYEFDGQPLYEYQGWDRIEHAGWGTRRFDVGREEVQSFLVSNAYYWIEKYHIDGLRVDAVASMLYLDYDKMPGEWVPNVYGDNKCLEAIAFFQKLNGHLAQDHPDVMTIAEESTAFANVTGFENGGLGFSLKWNMGWMNDSLFYAERDPIYRKYDHNKLTFSLSYVFSERYVLPISHDEVVHGKKSLLDRMPGDYWQKFAGTRVFMTYMMTHPGKKLLFMGSEIGQFREWDYEGQIEWFLTEYEKHAQIQQFNADLNHFYLAHPALWERDDGWEGFSWIDADNGDQSIYSYRRIDASGNELIVLLNFTPVVRDNFLLAVPADGVYEEIFNSDATKYGGSGVINEGRFETVPAMLRGYSRAINITVPPLGAAIFRRLAEPKPKKRAARTKGASQKSKA